VNCVAVAVTVQPSPLPVKSWTVKEVSAGATSTSSLSTPVSVVAQVWVAGAATPRVVPPMVAVPTIVQPALNVVGSQAADAELAAIVPPPTPITSADAASRRILGRLVRSRRYLIALPSPATIVKP
jgi:hypothetical protein